MSQSDRFEASWKEIILFQASHLSVAWVLSFHLVLVIGLKYNISNMSFSYVNLKANRSIIYLYILYYIVVIVTESPGRCQEREFRLLRSYLVYNEIPHSLGQKVTRDLAGTVVHAFRGRHEGTGSGGINVTRQLILCRWCMMLMLLYAFD